jgi:hypothetical protein
MRSCERNSGHDCKTAVPELRAANVHEFKVFVEKGGLVPTDPISLGSISEGLFISIGSLKDEKPGWVEQAHSRRWRPTDARDVGFCPSKILVLAVKMPSPEFEV